MKNVQKIDVQIFFFIHPHFCCCHVVGDQSNDRDEPNSIPFFNNHVNLNVCNSEYVARVSSLNVWSNAVR
jgi:hypothetical protein